MSIAREGIGLELAGPMRVGCARVLTLASMLAGARFPLNVSGGVARFRHRRARLERLEIELSARALERWVAPRMRDTVSPMTPEVWAGFETAEKATVSVSTASQPEGGPTRPGPAVAFDLRVLADREDIVLIVSNARGLDLPAPAMAIAIGCVEATLGSAAARSGATFTLRRFMTAVAREVLPQAGARVPSAEGIECALSLVDHDTWLARAARGVQAPAPDDSTLRARQAAALMRVADDELVSGDLQAARSKYLDALERAPRHPEIARRIVEIDAWTPGRAEAALQMIADVGMADDPAVGIVRGELLRETGDTRAAAASFERSAAAEPAPAIAALAYERAAQLTSDAGEAGRWLDQAIARAPKSTSPRWSRIRARLESGRDRDAVADVEHLEAIARGARAKSATWLRAGREWQAFGLHAHARSLFERALRFVPDSPEAMAGLAAALLSEGAAARSVSLLSRALEMTSTPDSEWSIRLDLARALAECLDDLPAAIAHARAIPGEAPQASIARGLEGRWRARLGDGAAASLAFERMRELAESLAAAVPPSGDASGTAPVSPSGDGTATRDGAATRDALVALLREAARWEIEDRRDRLAAERHLATALRLSPRDAQIRRELEALRDRDDASEPDAVASPRAASFETLDLSGDDDVGAGASADAARVEDLSRRLQLDPTDETVANELAALLEALGRGHELLALLSARLDDAAPARREALLPRVRATLERLAAAAEATGNAGEASLYRQAAGRLDEPGGSETSS